jgi:alanine dehydrogenase
MPLARISIPALSGKKGGRGHGALFPAEKTITFEDIVNGTGRGRTSADQISYSERGNLQGNQFWALAGSIFM